MIAEGGLVSLGIKKSWKNYYEVLVLVLVSGFHPEHSKLRMLAESYVGRETKLVDAVILIKFLGGNKEIQLFRAIETIWQVIALSAVKI